MYDLKLPVSMPELHQSCLNLQNVLTHSSMSDISGADLAEAIISLWQFLDIDQGHPKDVLNVLNKNNWCDWFPNTCTALRILQTIPLKNTQNKQCIHNIKYLLLRNSAIM